jgi:hypothetical protein
LLFAFIQPNLFETRQQCVSTGKTFMPREYNMTQLATFFPTPGSEQRNSSHSPSVIFRNGASDNFPNLPVIAFVIFFRARAF